MIKITNIIAMIFFFMSSPVWSAPDIDDMNLRLEKLEKELPVLREKDKKYDCDSSDLCERIAVIEGRFSDLGITITQQGNIIAGTASATANYIAFFGILMIVITLFFTIESGKAAKAAVRNVTYEVVEQWKKTLNELEEKSAEFDKKLNNAAALLEKMTKLTAEVESKKDEIYREFNIAKNKINPVSREDQSDIEQVKNAAEHIAEIKTESRTGLPSGTIEGEAKSDNAEIGEERVPPGSRGAELLLVLGHSKLERDDINAAIEAFAEAARRAPEDPRPWLNLTRAYGKIGNVKAATKAVDKAEELATASGDRRSLMIALNERGDLVRDRHPKKALELYQQAGEIAKELLGAERNAVSLRDMNVSWNKIGLLQEKLDNFKEALAAYEAGLPITEDLLKLEPEEEEHRKRRILAYKNIGDAHRGMEAYEKAMAAYEELEKFLKIAKPGELDEDERILMHLACFNDLGVCNEKLEMYDEAERYYKRARKVAEQLWENDPGDNDNLRHLATCLNNLGDVARATGRKQEAMDNYARALDLMRKIRSNSPMHELAVLAMEERLKDMKKAP